MAGHKPLLRLRQSGTMGKAQSKTIGIAIILAMVASCSDRSTQCNRLIGAVNPAVEQVSGLTQTATPQSVDALTRLADTLDRTGQQTQTVNLKDVQLQSYQNRLVSLYANTAKASRILVAARSQQNNAAIQQAYNNLRSAIQSEDALVTEVNNYCISKN